MADNDYEQEEQIDEMDQKLSFLDSFLSEDKDLNDNDNTTNDTHEQTMNDSHSKDITISNSSSDNDNDILLDKYIEKECGLNKQTTKATSLKEVLNQKGKNVKRNKYELIESKYGFTTESGLGVIAVIFGLLLLYVLHLLYFVVLVFSFAVFAYMLHVNKDVLLKHKHKLIEYLQRKQAAYAHLSAMNELSEIQTDLNSYYDDEQTQTLIHI